MTDLRVSTIDRAHGRWREILPLLGIETRFLANKHGPCPLCGGQDRYRFDDKKGSGSYYCSQCGPGIGITLICKLRGWNFKAAADEIDKIVGKDTGPVAPTTTSTPDIHMRARAIDRLLSEATSQDIVCDYLVARGIGITQTVLRGHRNCPYYDGDRGLVGRFPAVIAPIIAPDGKIESAHRIYIADLKPRKKSMMPIRTINGAAVRLFQSGHVLGVSEGVETGLAAAEMFGVPVWAALTENGVRTFELPPDLKKLFVFGDNDRNFVGQSAAYDLAKRAIRAGITVEVFIPPDSDTDWNDMLVGGR